MRMSNLNKATQRAGLTTVGMISLGCAKNLVDAEIMLGSVLERGMQITRNAEEADVLVVTSFDRCDAKFIAAAPSSLKVLATYSAGLEHIDLEAARHRGLPVLCTPDVLSGSVAEMAILLMLGAARRVQEGDRLIYSGQWKGWTPTQLVGVEITGRRLGILGMGSIGRTIARRARGFDMAVHYHNRKRLSPDQEQGATHHATLEGLLAQSDVLVIGAPSTPETRGLLNAARIAAMPEGAIVVNIARGDLIDDDALIAAFNSGRLAAAGLDVFNREPRLDERYKSLPNVFLQRLVALVQPRLAVEHVEACGR